METTHISLAGFSGKNADTDLEATWISAAKAHPAAFEPLYLRYKTRIYQYMRTRFDNDDDVAERRTSPGKTLAKQFAQNEQSPDDLHQSVRGILAGQSRFIPENVFGLIL